MTGTNDSAVRCRLRATWATLLVLLAASALVALVDLGAFNLAANVGIAVAKCLLVGLVFMELADAPALHRAVAVAGFAWLALLFVLGAMDVLTRTLPEAAS
ncbi:MAG: cytochrome C oxidase subunit IV family protein [Gammaproteobacteria bacterium]